jgi:hypothetical protein
VADSVRPLQRYRLLASALDARWQLPGTGIRFGWDAVIGLLPGLGDALGGLIGSYGLYVGWRLGAPVVVLARMLLNLAIETVAGTVPLAGDLFDIGWPLCPSGCSSPSCRSVTDLRGPAGFEPVPLDAASMPARQLPV